MQEGCEADLEGDEKVIDREKVIHAVETAFELWIDEYTGCSWFKEDEVRQAKEDALALLKEQKAVKPYVTGRGESFETAETWWYACGNCHEALDPDDKYCRHCGRQVKLDD